MRIEPLSQVLNGTTGSFSSQPSSEHNATTLVTADAGQNGCCYCKETGHEVDNCLKLATKLTHKCCATSPTKTTRAQLLTAGLSDDSFDDQPGGSKDWLFLWYDSPDALSDDAHDWIFLQHHGLNDHDDYHNVESKKSDGGIPTSWILLNNQSIVDA